MKQTHHEKNANATLLLCGVFDRRGTGTAKALGPGEYHKLLGWMRDAEMELANIFEPPGMDRAKSMPGIDPARLDALMGRGIAMALALERWINKGIWVLSFGDPEYPSRLAEHLDHQAPPILFGAGDRGQLDAGGLAIVGGRKACEEELRYVRDISERAVREGVAIISGGARGVDAAAMDSADANGGHLIGVLVGDLVRASISGRHRKGFMERRTTLICPYHPESGFSVGAAMGRNKIIYALADCVLAVHSGYQEGGTWAGATEELKRPRPRPIFVRRAADLPRGDRELISRGAAAIPELDDSQRLLESLLAMKPRERIAESLFDVTKSVVGPKTTTEESSQSTESSEKDGVMTDRRYESLIPNLMDVLRGRRGSVRIAQELGLDPDETDRLLQRATEEGRILRSGTKQVTYVAAHGRESRYG